MTLGHYERFAEQFWQGTRDHDVSQNIEALLSAIAGPAPLSILDFGCGPGRDLKNFIERGHAPIGLDGCAAFVEMARGHAGCEVWHQDFVALDLPVARFHGVFANASLFHVPSAQLPRVLTALHDTLRPGGVMFCSNPRGNSEGWNGDRYGCYFEAERWSEFFIGAGFVEVGRYYRPANLPFAQQPWLALTWRRGDAGTGS